jgi:membrane-associated phospholipid phosphatase
MPSLHIGWASWVAFGILPLARKRWVKLAVVLYPALTLFTIVVTGNHFWIDGVGGLVVLGLGFLIGKKMHDWNQARLDHKFEQLKTGHPSAGGAV